MKEVDIYKKTYFVEENEMNIKKHDEYNNLKIIPDLGILEREIGFFQELLSLIKNGNMMEISPTHGGYTANIDNYRNLYFLQTDPSHLSNIKKNLSHFKNHQNIHFEYQNPDFIFENKEKKIHLLKINSSTSLFKTVEIMDILINHQPILFSIHHKIFDHLYSHKFSFKNTSYSLYIPNNLYTSFYDKFQYYIEEENILNYQNLIHLTMIVKNAGDSFEDVLTQNLPMIDSWTILDTGSTDNTKDIIKKVLVGKKPGNLYEEPFINFRESRNRCLELAPNHCKYKIMLDDTYILRGELREFLETVRGDQFADSFSIIIHSNDSQYYSNRVLLSDRNLKYIYKIHEVIQNENNLNVVIPHNKAHIFDVRSDYMEDRTNNRKDYDLKLLFEMIEEEPDNPRHLYYVAQTYSCLGNSEKKAEYFLKRIEHPKEGFLQEKIDACFELARTLQFELKKPWNECEKYYNMAYQLDKTRPESIYFIGTYYFMNGNKEKAFEYLSKAFMIGAPMHAQYSLKPTLYFHFTPKLLTQLCYEFKDYLLGEKVSKFFLENNKPSDDMYQVIESWYGIFHHLNKGLTPSLSPKQSSKPILVYIADGGYKNWSGSDIYKNGVGGSETYIIEMSRHIQSQGTHDVYVFCNCLENEVFEGVHYRKISDYYSFIANHKIDICIISRFIQYLPVTYHSHVEKIYIVLHDLSPIGIVIPLEPKLKKIYCLTEWHKEYFKKNFPSCEHLASSFHYGIDHKLFLENELNIHSSKEPSAKNPKDFMKKRKYSFIYSSFANRGLSLLLKMWGRIKNRYPEATLQIFCDLENGWVNQNYPEEISWIKNYLLEHKSDTSIIYRGWVKKNELTKTWLESEVWFYPCKFTETFCLTALECAMSKTLAVTNDLGSLVETVGDRGIMIPLKDKTEEEWCTEALNQLFSILENEKEKERLIEKNYQWALQHTWQSRGKEFLNIIENEMNIKKSNNIERHSRYYIQNSVKIYKKTDYQRSSSQTSLYPIIEDVKEKEWYLEEMIQKMIQLYKNESMRQLNILEIGFRDVQNVLSISKELKNSIYYLMRDIITQNELKEYKENLQKENIYQNTQLFSGDSVKHMIQLLKMENYVDIIYINQNLKKEMFIIMEEIIIGWNLLRPGGLIVLKEEENIKDFMESFVETKKNEIQDIKMNQYFIIQRK